jgi:hypothetical protein
LHTVYSIEAGFSPFKKSRSIPLALAKTYYKRPENKFPGYFYYVDFLIVGFG